MPSQKFYTLFCTFHFNEKRDALKINTLTVDTEPIMVVEINCN